MTRFSLAVFAALLVLPSVAQAKIPVLDLHDDVCGFLAIQVKHSKVQGFSHFSCQTGNFVGVVASVKGSDMAIIASIQMKDRPGDQFLLQLSYPLVDGGTWSLRYTTDGYSSKLYKSGTYTVTK